MIGHFFSECRVDFPTGFAIRAKLYTLIFVGLAVRGWTHGDCRLKKVAGECCFFRRKTWQISRAFLPYIGSVFESLARLSSPVDIEAGMDAF